MCLSAISISQLILGLYMTVDTVRRGRESVTNCPHTSCLPHHFSVTDPTDPTSSLYYVRLRGTAVRGDRVHYHDSCIRYGASLAVHRSSRRHPDHLADVLAFSVIVFIVVRSNVRNVPIPGLLKTIVQDATYYFLVIFTSHFTLMMFLLFASVSTSS